MSKSAGNYLVPEELMTPVDAGGHGIDPAALRLALMSGYYRKPYNFTLKHLRDSAGIVSRYSKIAERARKAAGEEASGADQVGEALDSSYESCLDAMLDDLNTPKALAAALEGVKHVERTKSLSTIDAQRVLGWLERLEALLGFVIGHEDSSNTAGDSSADMVFAEKVEGLLRERANARSEKDWAKADEIRAELDGLGVEIQDSPDGTTWQKKSS